MNPEKEFKQWWDNLANLNAVAPYVASKLAWDKAFRLGHHQGMTRAAEIVQERGRGNPSSGTTPTGYRAIDPMITAQAILTERDKKEIT